MEYYLLNMDILDYKDGFFTISISLNNSVCKILFSPETRDLQYPEKNELTQFIKLKEFQLRKILHNKRPESYYKGFSLKFVLSDSLPDVNFYDKTKITILDNTMNQYIVKKTDKKTENIIELFTDGSFNHEKSIGGYALLIKTIQKDYYIDTVKTERKGNNLIELLAVIKGLEYLKKEKSLRIVTDSQYVIKGITEWLPVWKINNYYTANGTKAKNITEWKKVFSLIKEKYIEFEWVKSHTDHFENTICDIKARSLIQTKNDGKNK
ncbi:MAG: ribonuclease HI [Bacteroidales bacterium]|nr:ribonuclease HI [Bacteroidales bacterium]